MTYNGWTNYETWAVKLWIDNEEPTYRFWQEATAETWDECAVNVPAYSSQSQEARIMLSTHLKDSHEQMAPDLEGVYADLLSAALGEVDWFEIADALLTGAELEGYESR